MLETETSPSASAATWRSMHVTCAFAPGTLTAIVGPNGAGKTTYFNLISGQLKASSGTVPLDGQRPLRHERLGAHAGRAGPRVPADQPVPQPHGAGERAPGGAGHARRARTGAGSNLWSIWSDHHGADSSAPTRCWRRWRSWPTSADAGGQPAARRPAQARSGAADGAGAAGLHVRRAHGRHERRRGAGDPEPDPPAEAGQEQDHPAGGAQDGRGARTGRPHHRAAQRHAGGRWRAGRGDRLAGGAGSLSGRGAGQEAA